MLLALDTSTRYAGVALLGQDGRLLQALHWRSQQNHTVELMPSLELVLKRQGVSLHDLSGIAVAVGPGSFSALRVGLSLAKGLAWAAGLPLVTATTMEVEAFPYLAAGRPVVAVLEAGRGELAWASFQEQEGRLHQEGPERISSPQELAASLPASSILCGEGLERFADTLKEALPMDARLMLPYLPGQRLAALAYLGLRRLQAGETSSPVTLQPLYLRRPTITEPGRPIAYPG
ncbi:MAG: tRNA (adenosine(37)-N6)-threonylcarbamoyltransferase complex dimerization subunit type 1 TsaB [Chloroflexi bacterium]|nr:tRNA (adenosine(37)-N6)-threonylcarbamoyltransferase complex dimerization subunit type 1 TsaB [Chloroflexota bacterium]